MMVNEANARLKTVQITEGQLWGINDLYLLLDLNKDDFCKIVDAVGVDKLIAKRSHYERLVKADEELRAKEKFLNAKRRLESIKEEKRELEAIVDGYKPFE